MPLLLPLFLQLQVRFHTLVLDIANEDICVKAHSMHASQEYEVLRCKQPCTRQHSLLVESSLLSSGFKNGKKTEKRNFSARHQNRCAFISWIHESFPYNLKARHCIIFLQSLVCFYERQLLLINNIFIKEEDQSQGMSWTLKRTPAGCFFEPNHARFPAYVQPGQLTIQVYDISDGQPLGYRSEP